MDLQSFGSELADVPTSPWIGCFPLKVDGAGDPGWSPDGTRFAYVELHDGEKFSVQRLIGVRIAFEDGSTTSIWRIDGTPRKAPTAIASKRAFLTITITGQAWVYPDSHRTP